MRSHSILAVKIFFNGLWKAGNMLSQLIIITFFMRKGSRWMVINVDLTQRGFRALKKLKRKSGKLSIILFIVIATNCAVFELKKSTSNLH
jgi:hypothetical protein